jgi:hypothetical protein
VDVLEIRETAEAVSAAADLGDADAELAAAIHSSGGSLELRVQLLLPSGTKLNPEAPSAWSLLLPDDRWTAASGIDFMKLHFVRNKCISFNTVQKLGTHIYLTG